jgi:hypothetical protein
MELVFWYVKVVLYDSPRAACGRRQIDPASQEKVISIWKT